MSIVTIIISSKEISRYNSLREAGYVTLWSGEGKICMGLPLK